MQGFLEQGQRRGTLALERGAVEMVEHRHQRGQVAPAVREQVADEAVLDLEAAFQRMAAQGGGLLFVVERAHLVDQRLADARAQVFAQLELGRGLVTGQQQSQADEARGVEDAEQGDLGIGIEFIDVIDDQQAAGRRLKVSAGGTAIGEQQHRPLAQREARGGAQQVALAGALRPPEVDRVETARLREHAQARQQFVVFADDEVVEAGRLVRPQIEQQLGQSGVKAGSRDVGIR